MKFSPCCCVCLALVVSIQAESKLDSLERLVEKVIDDNAVLKEVVTKLEAENAKLWKEVKQLTEHNLHLGQNITSLRKRQASQNKGRRHIAFTALLGTPPMAYLKPHTTIVFNNAIENEGGAYSVYSGHFTAPVAGTYVFNLGLMCRYYEYQSFEFMRDGVSQLQAHCDSRGTRGVESSSRTLVIHLNQGQEIWVRTTESGSGSIWGNNFSNFVGFLLYED